MILPRDMLVNFPGNISRRPSSELVISNFPKGEVVIADSVLEHFRFTGVNRNLKIHTTFIIIGLLLEFIRTSKPIYCTCICSVYSCTVCFLLTNINRILYVVIAEAIDLRNSHFVHFTKFPRLALVLGTRQTTAESAFEYGQVHRKQNGRLVGTVGSATTDEGESKQEGCRP